MDTKKRMSIPTVLALTLALAACGGGGGGGAPSTIPSPPATSGTVSGVAAKGLLLNAIVTFYPITNGATSTTAITSTRTDTTTGAFSITLPSAGPILATLTVDANTQMLDEISGKTIAAPPGLVLHALIDGVTNLQPIALTPVTEMAYDIAQASSGGLTTTNIDAANNAVSTAFLGGAPALYTQPINLKNFVTASAAEQAQAKLLTAFAVAANEGSATGVAGATCNTTYAANLVCMVQGLGTLVTVSSTGTVTLASAAAYLASAYDQIDQGLVTLEGGQTPSALGLNIATGAETTFLTALAKAAPLPGFNSGANPLSNTKALFANIRTNIIDQASTQTFGFAPTLTALQTDFQTNVHPIGSNTISMLRSAAEAAELIALGTSNGGEGPPSPYINNPVALTEDSAGNLYVLNGDNTIAKVTGSTAVRYAGQSGVSGAQNGPAAQATFNSPNAIAIDSLGNVYVSDSGNNVIREITPAGTVSTLAGQVGVIGNSNGTGTQATFDYPTALAVDQNNNLYVADNGNSEIRIIAPGGVVSTLNIQPGASCSTYPYYTPGGSCLFNYVGGLAVDTAGNIYVAETGADTIQVINTSGVIDTFVGTPYVAGAGDGSGASVGFNNPAALTLDASGNLYLVDGNNASIREVTPAGAVSTPLHEAGKGYGYVMGVALNTAGGFYVANDTQSSIQAVSSTGALSTLIRSIVNYRKDCGYDPAGLNTPTNVALCHYGISQNYILLTVTQTGANTYTLQTQALENTFSGTYNRITSGRIVSPTIPALTANFTWTLSSAAPQSGTFSGPYYVNNTGGQVQGTLTAAESSNWNATTDSGSITFGGSLSGGKGGVSLVSATIGSDSVLTVENGAQLPTYPATPLVTAGTSPASVAGTLDIPEFNTGAFEYAAKVVVGAPVTDKSGAAAPPGTVSFTGSIDQLGANASTPLFDGTASLSLQGWPNFNATEPVSATNFFTLQARFQGTLALTAGRILTVSATANASQVTPTPTHPDSVSVTYSYTTPTGTAELNANGMYDATNGYSGTITNNAGVLIAVTYPIAGSLAGTVTDGGTETATVKGAFIYYSDGTSESLF
jgi:hypothetical protein